MPTRSAPAIGRSLSALMICALPLPVLTNAGIASYGAVLMIAGQ